MIFVNFSFLEFGHESLNTDFDIIVLNVKFLQKSLFIELLYITSFFSRPSQTDN